MSYLEFTIQATEHTQEYLIAQLTVLGFEGFEQEPNCLKAYIEKKENFEIAEKVQALLLTKQVSIHEIPDQNWNELWESQVQPIEINEELIVKAPFHNIEKKYKHCITIMPRMAFGTGHHATTQLMLETMQGIEFTNKKVLDFGCGSGILSIWAKMLGADEVLGIDIEPWAIDNAEENALINNTKIDFECGSTVPKENFDIILANINRNILCENALNFKNQLNTQGSLLCSGYFSNDKEIIKNIMQENLLILVATHENNNWVTQVFKKAQ